MFNIVKKYPISKSGLKRNSLLPALAIICFLFTVVRHAITGKQTYYFLNRNLLLAAIPWFVSLIISSQFIIKKTKILSIVLFFMLLIFFPNAPYIITDIYYLIDHPEKMFWYDLIMILIFAWTGLLFGFFSLDRIKETLLSKLSKVKNTIVTCSLLFVCAFGVYLGRELRWNSWEIFLEPREFFLDIIDRFVNPIGHFRTWGFTILMGSFLNIIYWTLGIIQKKTNRYLLLNNFLCPMR
jgi:uncharacterized membrane protein